MLSTIDYKRLWVVVLIACTFFSGKSFGQGATSRRSFEYHAFSIVIRPMKVTFQPGEHVRLTVTLKNNSRGLIPVYREQAEDQGGWVYQVDVRDAAGGVPPLTQYAEDVKLGFRGGGVTGVAPGKTIVDVVDVSNLCDLSHPGKYTIQVRRLDPDTKSDAFSNRIVISVAR